jgi:hypothetical protein
MMSKSKYIIGSGVLFVALAGGWFLSSQGAKTIQAVQVETAEADVTGPLDGMTFSGVIGSPGDPTRTKDKFVFSKGKFVSTECVKVCGYHAGSYFIRERDGKTEFLSVSHCTYKDAKIVWRGTIDNGIVKGESTWTVKRWYRTVEKKLLFEGKLVNASTPVAGK